MDLESQNSSLKFAVEFDSSFLTHYSQVFRKFVSRYNEVPHDEENIGRFEYENHNLKYLMEKFCYGNTYPIMALVDLIYTLNGALMQKIPTNFEILCAEHTVLILFEDQMDDISVHFGASETLDIYRELILGLRKWFPRSEYCVGWCELTFPLQSFASRFRIINKLLAKTNHIPHDYYMELMFPYCNPLNVSVCLSEFSDCIIPHYDMTTHYRWWLMFFAETIVLILHIYQSWSVLGVRFMIPEVSSVRVSGFCFIYNIHCEILMMTVYSTVIVCYHISRISVISFVYLSFLSCSDCQSFCVKYN